MCFCVVCHQLVHVTTTQTTWRLVGTGPPSCSWETLSTALRWTCGRSVACSLSCCRGSRCGPGSLTWTSCTWSERPSVRRTFITWNIHMFVCVNVACYVRVSRPLQEIWSLDTSRSSATTSSSVEFPSRSLKRWWDTPPAPLTCAPSPPPSHDLRLTKVRSGQTCWMFVFLSFCRSLWSRNIQISHIRRWVSWR